MLHVKPTVLGHCLTARSLDDGDLFMGFGQAGDYTSA